MIQEGAKAVRQHAERLGPECLLQRHRDLAALAQFIEHRMGFCGAGLGQRQGKSFHALARVAAHHGIAGHESASIDHQARMHDAVLVPGRYLIAHRRFTIGHHHFDLVAESRS